MSVLRSVPQTTFPIGRTLIGPDNIPGNVDQYVFTVHQFAWPNLGDLAFHYDAQASVDGGNTWASMTAGDLNDVMVPAKFGNPANQFKIACDIPGLSQGNRQVQIILDFAKSVTLDIQVDANTLPQVNAAAK